MIATFNTADVGIQLEFLWYKNGELGDVTDDRRQEAIHVVSSIAEAARANVNG
jgi:hypothetical protein